MFLVAPLAFRAPEGPAAVCAAARPARPLAVRAASFARRVGSKPGQAPQATRRPPIGRGVCVLPGQAPPPPTGPSGPSGALHAGGAVLLCVAERVGSKPGQAPAQRQFRMQFPRMCFMVWSLIVGILRILR